MATLNGDPPVMNTVMALLLPSYTKGWKHGCGDWDLRCRSLTSSRQYAMRFLEISEILVVDDFHCLSFLRKATGLLEKV